MSKIIFVNLFNHLFDFLIKNDLEIITYNDRAFIYMYTAQIFISNSN